MDRKELESSAARNRYLRGLLAIPVAILLFASGLGNMEWGPFRNLWLFPVCALAAAALFALLLRYYNDNYGRVLPRTDVRSVVGVVVAIAIMGGGTLVVQLLDVPLNGIALSWAVVALGYYATTVGLRPHHVVVWGAALVAALLPVWGDARTTDTSNFGMLIVGAAMLVTGVLDHRLLVRTFGSGNATRLEDSNAGG